MKIVLRASVDGYMAREFNWQTTSKVAYEAYQNGEFDKCERLFRQSYASLKGVNGKDIRPGYCCLMIGSCLCEKEQYRKAIPYLDRAVKSYSLHRSQDSIENLSWLARRFFRLQRWAKASEALFEAIEQHKLLALQNDGSLVNLLIWRGAALWRLGSRLEAERAFKAAVRLIPPGALSISDCGLVVNALVGLATGQGVEKSNSPTVLKLAIRACELLKQKLKGLRPPMTQLGDQVDNYFGTEVADPYRWLEDTSSEKVSEWLKDQTRYAKQFLTNIPGRSYVHQKMWESYRPEPYFPFKRGKYYCFAHRPFGCRRVQLFRVSKIGRYPKLVVDGNALPDNSNIQGVWWSSNGGYVAYGVSDCGSESVTLHIKDITTNQHCKERWEGLRFLYIYWNDDSSGFYYRAVIDATGKRDLAIYFHRIGSPPASDRVVYRNGDPDVWLSANRIRDSKCLLVTETRTSRHLLSLKLISPQRRNSSALTILEEQEQELHYVGSINNELFFKTTKDAPLKKLVKLDYTCKPPQGFQFNEVLAQQEGLLLDAFLYSQFIVAIYRTERGFFLRRFTHSGEVLGTVNIRDFAAVTDCVRDDNQRLLLGVEGYTFPKSAYLYTPQRDTITPIGKPSSSSSQYVTELQHACSKDGALVPVYLSYKNGLKRNGNNAVLLTGYGGFARNVDPTYRTDYMAWMELGGMVAEAVLRGDGNLGHDWRLAGTREQKQHTFSDFIAVAEHLIEKRITRSSRLGIIGGSNGGLLMGAVLIQRPDLFGAVVIQSGVLDVLRREEFDFAYVNNYEYGSAREKSNFRWLHSYSPLHRAQPANYPPVLITAATHDDRVSPAHSYKFAATLQKLQSANAPILLSVEDNAGHEGHYSSYRSADEICFLAYFLGLLPECLLSKGRSGSTRQKHTI